MSEHRNYVATLDGQLLDLGSLAIVYSYTGNVLDYAETAITLESGATATYRQTYTYTSGNVTGVSGWVRQ